MLTALVTETPQPRLPGAILEVIADAPTDNLTALRAELDHIDDEHATRPSLPCSPTGSAADASRSPHTGDQVARRTVLPSHDDVQLAIKRLTETVSAASPIRNRPPRRQFW